MTGSQFCWIAWCSGVAIIFGIVWLVKWNIEEDKKQQELQEQLKDMPVYHRGNGDD